MVTSWYWFTISDKTYKIMNTMRNPKTQSNISLHPYPVNRTIQTIEITAAKQRGALTTNFLSIQ